jgi:hypothetical protein
MASAYINQPYDGVQRMNGDSWLFYYGAKPGYIDSLSIGAAFSIVYTFRWRVVQFRVAEGYPGRPNIYVESTRPLEPDEIAYFEALVAEFENRGA